MREPIHTPLSELLKRSKIHQLRGPSKHFSVLATINSARVSSSKQGVTPYSNIHGFRLIFRKTLSTWRFRSRRILRSCSINDRIHPISSTDRIQIAAKLHSRDNCSWGAILPRGFRLAYGKELH